jgi:hypothetical protein
MSGQQLQYKDRNLLFEIKRNQTGYGFLVENEGFISSGSDIIKQIREDISHNDNFVVPHPFILPTVFQKYGIRNANGRIYPERVLRKQATEYLLKVQEKRAMGELNHPNSISIDLSRVALNVVSFDWEGHTLIGEIEIITSPGFRRHGIISCQGDQLANLLIEGYKVGVSSRGVGSVEKIGSDMVVGEDYEIICFDSVESPSTPNAWISKTSQEARQYVENVNNKPLSSLLGEKLNRLENLVL